MRQGGAFRLVGLILSIVGATVSITALVFSILGLVRGRRTISPRVRR